MSYTIAMHTYSWYKDHADPHSADTVHQILAYGSLDDILELRHNLGIDELRRTFISQPKKTYTRSGFNFIGKFVLDISTPLNEQQYLKDTPRHTG